VCKKTTNNNQIIMADIAITDDPTLGQPGTDIRVFGKWTGADVQISDMSLEVRL
jgi:hypothetical protein